MEPVIKIDNDIYHHARMFCDNRKIRFKDFVENAIDEAMSPIKPIIIKEDPKVITKEKIIYREKLIPRNIKLPKKEIESFSWYSGDKWNKPWLCIYRNKNLSHVEWGDGSIQRYQLFRSSLKSKAMEATIIGLFNAYDEDITNKSILMTGGVHGSFSYCPSFLGEVIFSTVKRFFNAALKRIVNVGGDQKPIYWDKMIELSGKLETLREHSKI